MSKTLIFERGNKEIRVVKDENGEPLFCLKDICESLEIQNNTDTKNIILKEFELPRLNLGSFDTGYGIKEFTMITEPQLYFILMRSDKPKAREFRQWVINEVLPSIRKSGTYSLTNQSLQDENTRLKDELISMQNEMIQTQKALIASLKQTSTKPVSQLYEKKPKSKYEELLALIITITQKSNYTQKEIWKKLYREFVISFKPKHRINITFLKENDRYLDFMIRVCENMLKELS